MGDTSVGDAKQALNTRVERIGSNFVQLGQILHQGAFEIATDQGVLEGEFLKQNSVRLGTIGQQLVDAHQSSQGYQGVSDPVLMGNAAEQTAWVSDQIRYLSQQVASAPKDQMASVDLGIDLEGQRATSMPLSEQLNQVGRYLQEAANQLHKDSQKALSFLQPANEESPQEQEEQGHDAGSDNTLADTGVISLFSDSSHSSEEEGDNEGPSPA